MILPPYSFHVGVGFPIFSEYKSQNWQNHSLQNQNLELALEGIHTTAWSMGLQLVFPVGPLKKKTDFKGALEKSKSRFLLDLNTVLPSKNVKKEILTFDFVAY